MSIPWLPTSLDFLWSSDMILLMGHSRPEVPESEYLQCSSQQTLWGLVYQVPRLPIPQVE